MPEVFPDEFQLTLSEKRLPLTAESSDSVSWWDGLSSLGEVIKRCQRMAGVILFRGFSFDQAEDLYVFVKSFGRELLSCEFGLTSRSCLGKEGYAPTEYQLHQVIPRHNEQVCALRWPPRIWSCCQMRVG